MSEAKQLNAYQLLKSMAKQGQAVVSAPAQGDQTGQWRAVGFRLEGTDFLAPMEQVDEVLYVPNCTRFPGVKPWVAGVANVRGRLLSVIDLGLFFGGKPSISSKRSRILAAKFNDLYTGIIVDEVLGIQSIVKEARIEQVQSDKRYSAYVTGRVEQDGQSWTVFDLAKLVQAPEFLQVAV